MSARKDKRKASASEDELKDDPKKQKAEAKLKGYWAATRLEKVKDEGRECPFVPMDLVTLAPVAGAVYPGREREAKAEFLVVDHIDVSDGPVCEWFLCARVLGDGAGNGLKLPLNRFRMFAKHNDPERYKTAYDNVL